jgi:NCS1 family nucleobase:cation symporter-1
VLLADYLFIKQGRIDLASLYSRNGMYWYWHGVNPVAVLWVAAGLATYFLLPVAAIQSLATVLITGAGYFVSMKLLVPRSARLARASAPVIAEAEAA